MNAMAGKWKSFYILLDAFVDNVHINAILITIER